MNEAAEREGALPCWFCTVCQTLCTVTAYIDCICCQNPARDDCPAVTWKRSFSSLELQPGVIFRRFRDE